MADTLDYANAPDYLRAADLHNSGSGNTSFFSDPIEWAEQKVTGVVDFVTQAPAFAVTSVASGINSIYNSGVVAGNWFGVTDAKENDLQSTLAGFDSDLGKYYENHKQSVDVAGFLVSSLVPGMGGIKLVNAGQRMLSGALKSGGVAKTFAESTGLIQTLSAEGKTLTTLAGEALAQGGQTFTVANAGVIKALASGVSQAALESAGFEMMVQATMFRSPVLEGQDIKDIGSNILTATVLGGAIGGVFNAAGVYGGIKKILVQADADTHAVRKVTGTFGLTEESDKIVIRAADIDAVPANLDARTQVLADKKIANARLDIRESVGRYTGEDKELGNLVADTLDMMSGNQIANVMGGAKMITRSGYDLVPAEGNITAYVRLHGVDGVGDVTFDPLRKSVLNIADKVAPKKGQAHSAAVDEFVGAYKFGEKKEWKIVTASSIDEVEARYIWAETRAKYTDGMKIDVQDIPLLEGALRNKLGSVEIMESNGFSYVVNNADDLSNMVLQAKREVADELAKAHRHGWGLNAGAGEGQNVSTITTDEIAKAVNVSTRALESESTASMFARQDAQAAFNKMRTDAGIKGEVNLNYTPSHAAVVYDSTRSAGVNSDLVSAMVNVQTAQKIAREKADRATAAIFGPELVDRFPATFQPQLAQANRTGAGAGIVSSSNSDYNTVGSTVEYIGKATADLVVAQKKATFEFIESPALRLRNNQEAAIEFSALNDMRNASREQYILNPAGDGLIAKSVQEYRDAVRKGDKNVKVPELQEGTPAEVLFRHNDTKDAVVAELQANGRRVELENGLRAAEGSESSKNPSVFYGWRPDENSMKHFAFVKDETISGKAAGHTSMIHASDEVKLGEMIKAIQGNADLAHLKVYTKADTERFFKARQDYEFDRTIHDNYIDSSLKSAGVNNQFFPKTDANAVVEEWLAHHSKRDTHLARDAVAVKYGNEFDELEHLGAQYTNVAASQKGVSLKSVESTVKNPYNDYRKTALNISRLGEYPILSSVNRGLETAVGRTVQAISDAFSQVKVTSDLPRINKLLEEAGISHSYKSAAEVILANHSAPKPYLSDFVRGANSILAATFLKLDFLNPIVNAVSAQVLLGHETNAQHKALLRDTSVAGVQVPGTTANILSPTKMIGRANADWLKDTPELDKLFKAQGLTSTLRDQMKLMLDDLSLKGTENPMQMNTRLASALEKAKQLTETGAKYTGNNLAEEYNRFVAAHVAKQIAETRIAAGVMPVEGLNSFMNTFVNRTQTNVLASQRPLLFQGPVGQAIGLFQSFQFNTMQQLFKGVADGGAKDAAMLLGLQGTIFGLNGLPGFQYINQHIIGTASGNKDHTDAYSLLYGAAGKTAGDWLMYGIPSNLLQTNLYSRGDINPRQLTVVPVAPQDIVAVSAFSKFAGNLSETLGKIAGGADVWQSVLQGLEHNGLSRPLAGLAQTLQATSNPTSKVFSTTGAGNISFVNDFMSLATLSRLAGGKPLDEALANDEVSRSMVYKAADRTRMKAATERFKTTVVGDKDGAATPEALSDYLTAYVRHGGSREGFNQHVLSTLTAVNTPRANQIISTLKGPYATHMKSLMGGSLEGLEAPTQ